MRVLYVCQRVPFPPNRGDKIASYHAIRHLSQRHDVTVAALADSDAEIENAAALRKTGVAVEAAPHPRSRARRQALRALAGSAPLSVAWYASEDLRERIRDLARRATFDVIVAFSSSMAPYASVFPDVPLVADFVDLDSQKWALYAAAHRPPRAWIYREEARRLLAYERDVARRSRFVILRTASELDDARRLIGEGEFRVVSNGVDLDYFSPSSSKDSGKEIVFTGVMDYFPNVEAVVRFADRVFPLVRREVPEATFTIVGANPVPKVRRLAGRPGVEVTGSVPDVRPYLRRARVAVAPLDTARGVQNKVLEALAMATPVVVSSAVSKGIDALPGDGILVADDPAAIALEVAGLLRDPGKAAALGRAGRALVERCYVWEDHLTRLEQILVEAAAPTEARQALGAVS